MSKIIAISNQKGGVAKTTTTANLGYILAQQGKRVLLVDLDPQANLTSTSTTEKAEMSITEVLQCMIETDELPDPSKYIGKAGAADILGSSIGLATVEALMTGEMGAQQFLNEILVPVRDRYDYILIDTPPSLGLLLVNALTAADGVIIPAVPEYYAISGIKDLLRSIQKVQRRLNPRLRLMGLLFTMVQARTNSHREVIQELAGSAEYPVFHTTIPRSVEVSNAVMYGCSIAQTAPAHKVTAAYAEFAKEVMDCGT